MVDYTFLGILLDFCSVRLDPERPSYDGHRLPSFDAVQSIDLPLDDLTHGHNL